MSSLNHQELICNQLCCTFSTNVCHLVFTRGAHLLKFKKGNVCDPNNYRAIAVASNLGKLFAGIFLNRLIQFRSEVNPDTPNQLGFCKGAQTADHILTLSTCIEKYVKVEKKRVFSCFVDYAKAFDTVCREALLYKPWKLGVQGRFFNCMEHMYTHSSAKRRLTSSVELKKGTPCPQNCSNVLYMPSPKS